MSRYEAQKRDGLARIGFYEHEEASVSLPAALDTDVLFPTLRDRALSNVPLSIDPAFVENYFCPGEGGQPVAVHPLAASAESGGDCVMVANWHTAGKNPRNYAGCLLP